MGVEISYRVLIGPSLKYGCMSSNHYSPTIQVAKDCIDMNASKYPDIRYVTGPHPVRA
ncbi:hypothetical protein YC2023_024505 [Brassica napus]